MSSIILYSIDPPSCLPLVGWFEEAVDEGLLFASAVFALVPTFPDVPFVG